MSYREFNVSDSTNWGLTHDGRLGLDHSNHSHSTTESWLSMNNNNNNNDNNNKSNRTQDPAARQHTRHARRLYFGGIPVNYAEEEMFKTYLNSVISVGLEEENDYSYIISVYINPKKFFAFVELKSIELTTACLDLDGIIYHGSVLKVHRANEYKPELVQKTESRPMIKLNLYSSAFIQLTRVDYPKGHSNMINKNDNNNDNNNGNEKITLSSTSYSDNSLCTKGTLSNITPNTIVIIGFPYEEGLSRCNRRLGTANGPKVIRRILKKMTNFSNPEFDADFNDLSIIDLGDIVPGPSLEEAHRRMAQLIREVMDKGGFPIVLGGSKDVVLSGIIGTAAALWSKGTIGMVSVDSALNCNENSNHLQNNKGGWDDSTLNSENVMVYVATSREFKGRSDLDSSTHSAIGNYDIPLTSFADDSTHGGDPFITSLSSSSSSHNSLTYSNHGTIGLDNSNHGNSLGHSSHMNSNHNHNGAHGAQNIGLLFSDTYTSANAASAGSKTTNSTNSNIMRENSFESVLSNSSHNHNHANTIANSRSIGSFGMLTSVRTNTTDFDELLDTSQHGDYDQHHRLPSFTSNSPYEMEYRSRLSFFGTQGVSCTNTEAKYIKELGGEIVWLSRDIRGRGAMSAATGGIAGVGLGLREQSSIHSPTDSGSTSDNKSISGNGLPTNLSTGQLLSKQIDKTSLACSSGRVYVSFSVESIMGCMFPGRDNLTADGFGADEFLDMALHAGSNPNVCVFSITDFSPDIEEHRSSKMMGDFLHSLFTGLCQRHDLRLRVKNKRSSSLSVTSHLNNSSSISNSSTSSSAPPGFLGSSHGLSPQNMTVNANINGNNMNGNQIINIRSSGSNDNLQMRGVRQDNTRIRTGSDSQMLSSPSSRAIHSNRMMNTNYLSNIMSMNNGNNHSNMIYSNNSNNNNNNYYYNNNTNNNKNDNNNNNNNNNYDNNSEYPMS